MAQWERKTVEVDPVKWSRLREIAQRMRVKVPLLVDEALVLLLKRRAR